MAELPLPARLNASTFPAKLWRLVNNPRICSMPWDSQARGLLIDRSLFERELLRQADAHGGKGEGAGAASDAFQATHFGSFVCHLNLYGVQKVPGRAGAAVPGDAEGGLHFRNPNFRRDRPDLLLRIKRLTRASRQRLARGWRCAAASPAASSSSTRAGCCLPSLPGIHPEPERQDGSCTRAAGGVGFRYGHCRAGQEQILPVLPRSCLGWKGFSLKYPTKKPLFMSVGKVS